MAKLFENCKTDEDFCNAVETMLLDTNKGLATKGEFINALAEQFAKHETFKSTMAVGQDVPTLKSQIESLNKQIAQLKTANFDPIKDQNKNYNGIWGNIKQCRDFGLFVLASVNGHQGAADRLKNLGYELKQEKAMGEDANSTGGVLVPTDFIANMIMLVEQYGVMRQLVDEYPMASDRTIAPKWDSGLTVYCPGAGGTITASDIGLNMIEMVAKKWATLTVIDSELDEDSAIAVGELVGRGIAMAFAKKEDEVMILGDGTSTYFGHVGICGALKAVDSTIGNIKSLAVGSGNAYSELTVGDFEKLLGILPDYADVGNDVNWVVNRYFYYTVMVALAVASSNASATEILTNAIAKQKTFMAYPVKFSAAMPKAAANSQICALFGNYRLGAYMGTRRQMSIARSDEVKFAEDQIAIRGTERVAPTVHGVGDTADAGPICGLITAAS